MCKCQRRYENINEIYDYIDNLMSELLQHNLKAEEKEMLRSKLSEATLDLLCFVRRMKL